MNGEEYKERSKGGSWPAEDVVEPTDVTEPPTLEELDEILEDGPWNAFDRPLSSRMGWPRPEVPSYPEYAAAPLEYPREPNYVALRVGQLTPDQMARRIRELERESLMANGLIGGLYKDREQLRAELRVAVMALEAYVALLG